MLINPIRMDQFTPEQMLVNLDEWRATGASEPSLMDILSKPPVSMRIWRPIHAAVVTSDAARKLALDYLEDVEDKFLSRVIDLTQGLTSDRRNVADILAELELAQVDAKAAVAARYGPQAVPRFAFGALVPSMAGQANDRVDDGYRLAREAIVQRQASIDSLQKGLLAEVNQVEETLSTLERDLIYGGIGVRQNLVNRIKTADANIGIIVRQIAKGEPQRLLAGLFGEDRAATYCMALYNELLRLGNARGLLFPPVPVSRTRWSDEVCLAIVKRAISPLDVEWFKDPGWKLRFNWPPALRGPVVAISNWISAVRSRVMA